jgi:hypothetical protein
MPLRVRTLLDKPLEAAKLTRLGPQRHPKAPAFFRKMLCHTVDIDPKSPERCG